jgi:hypothetical protein
VELSRDVKLPAVDIEFAFKIGHLPPEDEEFGWQARLVNLGYYAGAVISACERRG